MTEGERIAAELKARTQARKIRIRKEWCSECGRLLGTHRFGISGAVGSVAAPFELAPGFVPTGKRAYEPGKVNRTGRRRGGGGLVINRPGPITITCECGTTNTFLHPVGTVV